MKALGNALRVATITALSALALNGFSPAPAGLLPAAAGSGQARIDNANELVALAAQQTAINQAADPAQTADAYANALAQAAALPAAAGAWHPVGKPPLRSDTNSNVSKLGWKGLSGRVTSFSYDPNRAGRWFLTSSDGGVWETTNGNAQVPVWRSIGDGLPTQIMGGVAYTPANKGTIVAASGDPAFCWYCIPGVGVFTSTDDGRTWKHATGVPNGALSFRVVVDPGNPNWIYVATSKGLYRSTDTGATFANVHLPTSTNCAKDANLNTEECFFANMVTDVVVRTPDSGGAGAHKVLAVVGWRASQATNADGKVQSPSNGLYSSPSGAPGTFTYLSAPSASLAIGFPLPQQIGRTALGIAHGAGQNHDVVYALVQDALKMTTCETIPVALPVLGSSACPKTAFGTILDGLYVSPDFGAHWTKMTDWYALRSPFNNSALAPFGQVGYNPGVQAWYNLWVEPDPTATDPATKAPTRMAFGLEEVWENDAAGTAPLLGPTSFHVIARYWNACPILVVAVSIQCNPYPNQPSFGPSTTHPDQHAGIFVPDTSGVTLLVGNDGGVYRQRVGSGLPAPAGTGGDFDNDHWGDGINTGINTLQPYDAEISRDGTVVAGLQDNGQISIDPATGVYSMTDGGDAFFTGIDPANSLNQIEEYTNGGAQVTTDGGNSWSARATGPAGAQFVTPLQIDPVHADHFLIGGRTVQTSTGYTSITWQTLYDLGTQLHPGDPSATAAAGDTDNVTSSLDYRNSVAYVGFCGHCDPLIQGGPFKNGIATSLGGWHIVKAKGLPNRYITSVRMDPANARTIYVTLGGYSRHWVPPGATGEQINNLGTGHIFVSRDAGATFSDLSGKGATGLPDAPAEFTALHAGQLIVATDVGVFVGTMGASGMTYAVLGTGLPHSRVVHLAFQPGNPRHMIAAVFGRSVWSYDFSN